MLTALEREAGRRQIVAAAIAKLKTVRSPVARYGIRTLAGCPLAELTVSPAPKRIRTVRGMDVITIITIEMTPFEVTVYKLGDKFCFTLPTQPVTSQKRVVSK